MLKIEDEVLILNEDGIPTGEEGIIVDIDNNDYVLPYLVKFTNRFRFPNMKQRWFFTNEVQEIK